MHYIRQFFTGDVEGWVHDLFTRYGRGDFLGPVCEAEVKKSVKFKGSFEYISAFGEAVCSIGEDLSVDGGLFSKEDFRPMLDGLGVDYSDKSKPKKGAYAVEINGVYPSSVVYDIFSRAPYAQPFLNLKCGKASLKCKKKPPKPGKDKDLSFMGGEVPLDALPNLKDILFDVGDFTKVKVENTFIIERLIIPPGLSPDKARLDAKRAGKIKRVVIADEKEISSECQFEV
jgi:hypothetical protein